FSFASQTKNKATSEVWKPFWAPNLAHFYGFILQRALSLSKKSSESWAFSFTRGKIAIGGEKDAGMREDGSQCDRDGGNRWPGTRGVSTSENRQGSRFQPFI
ncbi:hypothetical protein, partial [Intestinimonas butyriciproducens]|uniref:hypothetical protein n=1 Tax=Intestinimonas butyriciproducens TaxID=1297617 RepID=UPI001FAF3CF2